MQLAQRLVYSVNLSYTLESIDVKLVSQM